MVAILNQPQYAPVPMEGQVVSLWAGVNGYLDDIPTPQVPRFEQEWREHLLTEKSVLDAHPRDERHLDDETEEKLKAEIEKFKNGFNVEEEKGLVGGQRGERPGPQAAVRSVRNTRKITKAMELVASARLRRAQTRIEAMRPYADRMLELIGGVARAATSVRTIPLLQRREVQTVAIVPLTGDRGLAGAFNGQVLRRALAARARAAERGQGRPLARGRQEGPLDPHLPALRGDPGVDRLQRPARVSRRAGDRARARGPVRERRGRRACGSSTTATSHRSCSR